MKHKFTVLTVLIVVVALIISLVACSGSKNETDNENTTNEKKIEQSETTAEQKQKETLNLRMTVFTEWATDGFKAMIEKVNTNEDLAMKVELDIVSGGEQGEDIIKVRAAAGDYPELLAIHNADWINKNLDKGNAFLDVNNEWVDNFPKSVIDSPICSLDGKVIGQPFAGATTSVMYYNKEVFQELNISIPKTWNELLDACNKIKNAGKVPVFYSGKDAWPLTILPGVIAVKDYADNPKEFQEKFLRNEIKYTDHKNWIDGIYKLKELVDNGYVNETYLSDTHDIAQSSIVDGTAAMYPGLSPLAGKMSATFPDKIDKIGAFAIPVDNSGIQYIPSSVGRIIAATNKNKDPGRVKELFNYIATTEVQMEYFMKNPDIPIFKGIDSSKLNMPSVSKDIVNLLGSDDIKVAGTIFAKYNHGVNLAQALQNVLIGAQTPEEVMKEMDEGVAKEAKAAGDSNWN